ncbi:MAG TPA: hypothetical protein PLA77_01000 [Bacteroidales bacterium]|nr:hypothetical protein [Bacteroidales bacterium]
MSAFNKLLSEIFKYKRFPYYASERRLDAIISLFLPEIVKEALYKDSESVIQFVMPEFPISKSNSNQAVCADYILIEKTQNEINSILLVELKTDRNSIKPDQFDAYTQANWADIVDGLKAKSLATPFNIRNKYFELFLHLAQHNLITLDDTNTGKLSGLLMLHTMFSDLAYDDDGKVSPLFRKKQREITKYHNEILDEMQVPAIPIKTIYLGPYTTILQNSNIDKIFFSRLYEDTPTRFPDEWDELINYLKRL